MLQKSLITCAVLALLSSHAVAAVVGGAVTGGKALDRGGVFQKLDSNLPFSVGADNFGLWNLLAFDEDQDVMLRSPLAAEIGGEIHGGTMVSSHFVIYDPPNDVHEGQVGYIDFDEKILGVALSSQTLRKTQFLADGTAVTFRRNPARGVEGNDRVWIDPAAPNRLWVSFFASTPGDHLRVITAASSDDVVAAPLPAGWLSLGAGLAVLCRLRRRRG